MPNLHLLVYVMASLAFVGCTLDSESIASKGAETPRTISQELRSSCPERPAPQARAARLLEEPVLVIDTADRFILLDSVYDASGALIDADRMEMRLDSAEMAKFESRHVIFMWNGTDGTGRPVEGGNSFHFYRLLDEADHVVLVDSTCVGHIRGTGD